MWNTSITRSAYSNPASRTLTRSVFKLPKTTRVSPRWCFVGREEPFVSDEQTVDSVSISCSWRLNITKNPIRKWVCLKRENWLISESGFV
ncbi:hypothetical protein Hanom_Chr17g01547431 [Helianthus anomalus]